MHLRLINDAHNPTYERERERKREGGRKGGTREGRKVYAGYSRKRLIRPFLYSYVSFIFQKVRVRVLSSD